MSDESVEAIRVGGVRISLERLTYATVVEMSVLAVYDGWGELATFGGVALVILGPVIALAVAHFFAEAMQAHAQQRRSLTGAEWRGIVVEQVDLLLVAVPPLVMLGLGWISPLDARSTIEVLLWTGVLTLVGLSGFTARRAGFHGWRLALASLSGGVVGLIVIALQVVLKPH